MIALEDLICPLTVRYNLATSWGSSSQELTFDVPELDGQPEAQFAFVNRLWRSFIATALSRTCQLSFVELVRWRITPLAQLGASGGPVGAINLPAAALEETGVMTLHTGDTDRYARRQLYWPNMPKAWQQNRVLSDPGMNGLYAVSALLFMGMGGGLLTGPITWLLAFPRVVDQTPSNLFGVAFRKVQWVRIHSYCARGVDEVPLNWP